MPKTHVSTVTAISRITNATISSMNEFKRTLRNGLDIKRSCTTPLETIPPDPAEQKYEKASMIM